MMKASFICLIIAPWVWSQPPARTVSQQRCSLVLKVLNPHGTEQAYEVESFRSVESGKELVEVFKGMFVEQMQCGAYDILLKPSDRNERKTNSDSCRYESIKRRIAVEGYRTVLHVFQAKEHCLVRDTVDWVAFDGLKIQIKNLPRTREAIWCALAPAFDNGWDKEEAPVDNSGTARFTAKTPEGLYLLSIYVGGEVKALVPLRVVDGLYRPRAAIEIDLNRWRTAAFK